MGIGNCLSQCRGRVSDDTKYSLLLALGLFITSLFKRSLDARQSTKDGLFDEQQTAESAFLLTAIGHGGYLTFCLAGCGRLFGADFNLVGDFQ